MVYSMLYINNKSLKNKKNIVKRLDGHVDYSRESFKTFGVVFIIIAREMTNVYYRICKI